MSDLIDRDKAIEAISQLLEPIYDGKGNVSICILSQANVKRTLNELPSAVVRCKECKHYVDEICDLWDNYLREDFFCGFGERRTDG